MWEINMLFINFINYLNQKTACSFDWNEKIEHFINLFHDLIISRCILFWLYQTGLFENLCRAIFIIVYLRSFACLVATLTFAKIHSLIKSFSFEILVKDSWSLWTNHLVLSGSNKYCICYLDIFQNAYCSYTQMQ